MGEGRTEVLDGVPRGETGMRGSSRTGRLATWLSSPRDDVQQVILEATDPETGKSIVLERWQHIDKLTALRIDEAISAYCADLQQTVTGMVRLVDGNDRDISTRRIQERWQREGVRDFAQIEGTAQSALRQCQEHQAKVIQTLEDLTRWAMSTAGDRERYAQDRNVELAVENQKLRRELEEAKDQQTALIIEGSEEQADPTSQMLFDLVKEFRANGVGDGNLSPTMVQAAQKMIATEVQKRVEEALRVKTTPAPGSNGAAKS